VNLTGILAFVFLVLGAGLVIGFALAGRKRPRRQFRDIPAFTRLRRSVGLAVEAGTRLHIALGRGDILGIEFGSGLVGLAMQDRIARAASVSDRPPVSTSGNGALGILSRDTFTGAYRSLGAEGQFDPTLGRVVGLTPVSYAAGVMPVVHDEQVSSNLLLGNFGLESALITEAAERSGSLTVAGTDLLQGQAVLYAAAQEPLIGEEVYSGGAYLNAGPVHDASLRAQDILRFLIILLLLTGALLRFLGIDQPLQDWLSGFSQ
jgi:hypothetical protein